MPNITLFEDLGLDIRNDEEVLKNYIRVQKTFCKKNSVQFLKTHSYQKIQSDKAAVKIGEYGSRLCMLEGFVGHAEQCNLRIRRYGGKNIPFGTAAE